MAESDIQDVSLSAGSEAVFDIVCQPCSSDGKAVEAEVYCRDCREHLCGQCIKDHKKFSSMKHHQLVDKDAMPGTQDDLQVRDVCTERCPDHKEEITKYFCPDHKTLACGVCVTIKHKRCDDMDYIQDVAASLEDRQDYADFTANLGGLKQKSKATVTLALENKERASDCHAKVMEDLDVYRDELVDAVDKNIQDLRDKAGQILAKDTERMDKLADLGNQALNELQSVESDIEDLTEKKHFCKMFVDMKRKEPTLSKLQANIDSMGGAATAVKTYTFQPGEELRTKVGRQGGLGELVMTSPDNYKADTTTDTEPRDIQQLTATHLADINVKSTSNEDTCEIKGMAMLSQTEVVVADNSNKTIKLIDTVNDTIISEITLDSYPWDVAVCNDTIATTLPFANKILFLKYDGTLVHDKDISVDGDCEGIDWYDDKLYVTFDEEKKLEVMTTTGIVLQKFTTTDTGEQLFQCPWYVRVCATNKRIYVSDLRRRQVIILDMDGKQTGVCDDDEFVCPAQLAVDRTGVVFISDYGNVHQQSPDGEKVKILLTSMDGLNKPRSMCYCENTRRLYVGMEDCDTVKAYQIS